MFPSNQKFQSKMVFEAAELPQRGLVIQVQKSLTSNPINADKGLVVDSSTTQMLLKNPNTPAME